MEDVIRYLNKKLIAALDIPVSLGQPADYKNETSYAKVTWDHYLRDSSATTVIEEMRGHIEIYSKEANIYWLLDKVVSFLKGLRHKFALENGDVISLIGDPTATFLDLADARKVDIIFSIRKEAK